MSESSMGQCLPRQVETEDRCEVRTVVQSPLTVQGQSDRDLPLPHVSSSIGEAYTSQVIRVSLGEIWDSVLRERMVGAPGLLPFSQPCTMQQRSARKHGWAAVPGAAPDLPEEACLSAGRRQAL
jgi:hypothetical protein